MSSPALPNSRATPRAPRRPAARLLRTLLPAALLVTVLTACGGRIANQFVIRDTTPAENARVHAAIRDTVAVLPFDDVTTASSVPGTLCFYAERTQFYRSWVGARLVEKNTVVDLGVSKTTMGRPPVYAALEDSLTEKLSAAFGDRFTIPDEDDRIPIPPPAPRSSQP